MDQYDKNGLIIENGIVKRISDRVLASGIITIPSEVKYILKGITIYTNAITYATIKYNSIDNILSILNSEGFKPLMGHGNITLEGPLLTYSEKELIKSILRELGNNYSVTYNVIYDNDLLTEKIGNEYTIEDGVLLY